jgi:alkanesulfonate monooxygenase SsuD/methylene tetrahydromethanopterin reductase-like flavin-dependent oxidoreductase (luciferase family)
VHAKEYMQYREGFLAMHGKEPPRPITSGHVLCDTDGERARANARIHLKVGWERTRKHYDFMGEHLKTTKGYEYYANAQKMVATMDRNAETEDHIGRQVVGTPDECFDRIMRTCTLLGTDFFIAHFSSAGQRVEEAERSMHLFAEKVMPRLKAEGIADLAAAATA